MFEKLGKFINRRKKPVLVTFVIALLLSGFFGFQAFSRFDSGGYNDPNSDSAKVQQILEDEFEYWSNEWLKRVELYYLS